MPMLRLFFLAICLCLAPCTPRAEGLFIHCITGVDDDLNKLQIIPITSRDQKISSVYAWAVELFLANDVNETLAVPHVAMAGEMDALFALAALSRLAEAEKRPSPFDAPAAFWEDWAVRMLGGKESWFRIGAALFEYGKTDGFPTTKLQQMATDALRKAAKLGHPEAMYALAYLSKYYPDKTFQIPKDPGFTVIPSTTDNPDDSPEFRYWLSAAAFHGSARATYISGMMYYNPDHKFHDEKKCFEMLSKSVQLGLIPAACTLTWLCDPTSKGRISSCSSCKSITYYGILMSMMADDELMMVAYRDQAEAMMEGNNKYFPEPCLTWKEYEDTVREVEQDFERIKADLLAKKEAHDALYAKAQPMLEEMRAAFVAQMTR